MVGWKGTGREGELPSTAARGEALQAPTGRAAAPACGRAGPGAIRAGLEGCGAGWELALGAAGAEKAAAGPPASAEVSAKVGASF